MTKKQSTPQSLGKRVDNYAVAIRQLQQDVQLIRSLINVEHKYVDTALNGGIGNTLIQTLLNGMVRGTGVANRNGRSVKATKLELRYHVDAQSSMVRSQLIRVMLVVDKFPHATTFLSTDLLGNVSPEGMINRDNKNRFSILYDETHVLCPDGEDAHFRDVSKKIKFHTKFDDSSTGNISDITENAVYLCAISNDAATPPAIDAHCRFIFVDN